MPLFIRDIACHLPERVLTNAELGRTFPQWDMKQVEQRAGVVERHVVSENETALDLAIAACETLLARRPGLREKVDGLIFCTQSEDYILPANSALLHRRLELSDKVFAFDFNLACSGYIYGLMIAEGLLSTGTCKNILLVTADTYSKYIHAEDRSARVLFGDGAAVSWLSGEGPGLRLVGGKCETSGKHYAKFMIPAGGCRLPRTAETATVTADANGNRRSLENIKMDGMGVLTFVNTHVPPQLHGLLDSLNLGWDEIGLTIFHQASKMALDSLGRILKIPAEKTFSNLDRVGNTVSASIPMALRQAFDEGRVPPGKVLLCGFGVGLSWGSCVLDGDGRLA